MKGQVARVVSVEIAAFDGSQHRGVERPHVGNLRWPQSASDGHNGCSLESTDDLVDVSDVFERELVDQDTPPRQDRHKPFQIELDQGVPQRRSTDAEPVTDLVQIEKGSGTQLTAIDRPAQILVDLLAEGSELQDF